MNEFSVNWCRTYKAASMEEAKSLAEQDGIDVLVMGQATEMWIQPYGNKKVWIRVYSKPGTWF